MSAIGAEQLTSQTQIAYPFAENALGLARADTSHVHGAEATIPLDFIVDAVITAPATVTSVYLTSITRLAENNYRFIFSDQAGSVILTHDLTALPVFSPFYSVIEMQNTVSNICIKLVVIDSFNNYLLELADLDVDSFQARLPFEQAIITPIPARVSDFAIGLVSGIKDDIKVSNGYNTEISVTEEDNIASFLIDAAPSIGKGLYPCDDAPANNMPLKLIPDSDGNVNIVGDDCYTVIPQNIPGVVTRIELQGNCYACCECEQYVNVGNAIRALVARAYALKNEFLSFNTNYNTTTVAYNEKADDQPIIFSLGGSKSVDAGSKFRAYLHIHNINTSAYDVTLTDIIITGPPAVTITPYRVVTTIPAHRNILNVYTLTASVLVSSWDMSVTINYVDKGEAKTWSGTITI